MRSEDMTVLSPTSLRVFRAVVGLSALQAALALLLLDKGDRPISFSLLLVGIFTLGHLLVDLFWARLWVNFPSSEVYTGTSANGNEDGNPQTSVNDEVADVTPAFRETVGLFVSTSGVILGLVTAFQDKVVPALKAGSVSLAIAILLALILYGFVLHPLPPDGVEFRVAVGYLFTLTMLALSFGLFSVAMSIVFRS
jgi:hypothetical protein